VGVRLERERGRRSARDMAAHEQREVEIEDAVTVDEEERLAAEEVADLPGASPRAQDPLLPRGRHREAARPPAHGRDDALGQVMEVDHDLGDPVAREALERPEEERPVEDGQRGLRAEERQRPHALAPARGEDHGLHPSKTMSPRPPDAKKRPTYESVMKSDGVRPGADAAA